jgi:hypothetical protein
MKTKSFAYDNLDGVPAWVVIENAIESLVKNGDLVEKTHRRYLVGLLVKSLEDKGMLTVRAIAK